MLMVYGLFVFSVRGIPFDALERERNWRWAANEPVGAPPVLQYLGRGGETITLSGVLHPEYTAGTMSLDMLQMMADTGKQWLLMSGYGNIYGYYVLEQISDAQTYQTENGIPQRIEFTITLRRYAGLHGMLGKLAPLLPLLGSAL